MNLPIAKKSRLRLFLFACCLFFSLTWLFWSVFNCSATYCRGRNAVVVSIWKGAFYFAYGNDALGNGWLFDLRPLARIPNTEALSTIDFGLNLDSKGGWVFIPIWSFALLSFILLLFFSKTLRRSPSATGFPITPTRESAPHVH